MDTNFTATKYLPQFAELFLKVEQLLIEKKTDKLSDKTIWKRMQQILREYPKDGNEFFSRDELISGYRLLVANKSLSDNPELIEMIRLKPTRTISGVTPITVLTKPFPCPGKCIFCPNDVRMPKSYIASEPGAQRAGRNAFDPYLQTYNRLLALQSIGHNVNKAELIVLGGTWSFYPESYQIWFIKRCFDALNDFGNFDDRTVTSGIDFFDPNEKTQATIDYNKEIALKVKNTATESATWEELQSAQEKNETANCRNVGLVLETRPDYISISEVIKLRRLGATKIQIGIQSLNDEILNANGRGTTVAQIKSAFRLLRLAGFKIHGHMMPNLYLATPKSDLDDYKALWTADFAPDELKIYPTSVIKGTLLYQYLQQGKYQPYDSRTLIDLLKECFKATPVYCRLTRVIRDIPSGEIITGNKTTNLRQIVELELDREHNSCKCIRCREIKGKQVAWDELDYQDFSYDTSIGVEHFLSYNVKQNDKICGFLRLALPTKENSENNPFKELQNAAIIREVHVYGKVTQIGNSDQEHTQHLGIGKHLIANAEALARKNSNKVIAVISAIGTRNYYRKLGFEVSGLYMTKSL